MQQKNENRQIDKNLIIKKQTDAVVAATFVEFSEKKYRQILKTLLKKVFLYVTMVSNKKSRSF